MMKTYIILIFLTLFAFLIGWLEVINSTLVIVLLITTFIKGQLVIDYFMGLKDVAFKYRSIPIAWLSFVMSFIAVAYYM